MVTGPGAQRHESIDLGYPAGPDAAVQVLTWGRPRTKVRIVPDGGYVTFEITGADSAFPSHLGPARP
ncbi:MAG: hypothetical protein HOQ24_03175 [Mycobacteriaceae bacterium]|nr:hypothetical protein [Mycobacteriaceae bacterium]